MPHNCTDAWFEPADGKRVELWIEVEPWSDIMPDKLHLGGDLLFERRERLRGRQLYRFIPPSPPDRGITPVVLQGPYSRRES